MKKYDSYKDTGISWFGEIPEHWEINRMRYIISYEKGKNPKELYFDSEEGMLPYLSMDYLRESFDFTQYSYSDTSYTICKNGDIVLLWDGANAGEFIKSKDGILCSTCALIKPKNINSQYFWYLSNAFQDYLQDMTNGMGVPHVDSEELKNLTVVVPPIDEQEVIAEYLDKKCGSIDGIIATQERRIALLNELKQTIITEAVTHGINPDVTLKDSGIDWIGQIPECWEIRKVTHIFKNIGSGTTPSTNVSDYYDENGLNWLQTGDLNDSFITETSKHITPLAVEKCNLKQYNPNSLVIAMYGATIGKLGILSIPTTVNQACCVLTPSSTIDIEFAFFSFLAAKQYLISLSTGGGQPNISQDIISRHKLAVPPYNEQVEIVKRLKKKCAGIDSALAKAKREVELLREYKQSVITEAVTGKIKVY